MISSIKLFISLLKLKQRDYRAWIAIIVALVAIIGEGAYIVWMMYGFLSSGIPTSGLGVVLDAWLIDLAIIEGAMFAFYRYVGKLLEGNMDVKRLLEDFDADPLDSDNVIQTLRNMLESLDAKFDLVSEAPGEYILTIRSVTPLLVNVTVLLDWIADKVEIMKDESSDDVVRVKFRTS